MKKVIVGRGLDCDIVVPDETDNVSRQHLVISFDFLGRMKVSDTSSNGTYINGRRMLKGTSIPVTRNDEIRMGDRWKLNWDEVRDPKRKSRLAILIALVVLMLGGIGVGLFFIVNRTEEESHQIIVHKPVETGGEEWNKDSTMNVAPVETSIKLEDSGIVEKNQSKDSDKRFKAVGPGKSKRSSGKDARKDSRPVTKDDRKSKEKEEVPIVN